MIGYFTDNNVSQTVMKAFSRAGYHVDHIRNFDENKDKPSMFYGILRGSGSAMQYLKRSGIDYWYIDNGYFDAIYMDENKVKHMDGKYRMVKNDMIEPYTAPPVSTKDRAPMNVLLLPPSPYSAFMYDTTPEDWMVEWLAKIRFMGDTVTIRKKEDSQPFMEQVKEYDAVFAFNNMAVMPAIKMGKAVYTTHGIIRNADMLGKDIPYYDYKDVEQFYESKQFTLEEVEQGKLLAA